MWSGATVPFGWALCNGQTVNTIKTPNLVNQFILGSGGSYPIGTTGGQANPTFTTTSAGGAVGLTTDGTILTPAQSSSLPVCNGNVSGGGTVFTAGAPYNNWITSVNGNVGQASNANAFPALGPSSSLTLTSVTGNINTNFLDYGVTGSSNQPYAVGGNQPHTHTFSELLPHTHNVVVATYPPFYSLAYIMRVQ